MSESAVAVTEDNIQGAALCAQDQALLTRLLPRLQTADIVRQEKYGQYCWRRKIAAAAFTLLAPVTAWVDYMALFVWPSGNDDSGAGLTLILAGALYHWMNGPKRAYARAYKTSVLPEVAQVYGLKYDIDGKIAEADITAGGIAPNYDRYSSEDYFAGTYKSAGIRFAEIKLEQKRRSKRRTYYVTVFKGLAVAIKLPKPRFYGHTIVVRDGAWLGEWARDSFSKLKRADLVDPVFEKKYSVFTNDQVEARYLLDPAMIERINQLEQPYEGKGTVSVSYRDGTVFMLLPSKKDLFEPADIAIPATDPHALAALRRQVGDLLGIIDQLEFYKPPPGHDGAALQ